MAAIIIIINCSPESHINAGHRTITLLARERSSLTIMTRSVHANVYVCVYIIDGVSAAAVKWAAAALAEPSSLDPSL